MTLQPSDPTIAVIAPLALLVLFRSRIQLPPLVMSQLSTWVSLAPAGYMARLIELHVRSGWRDPNDLNNTLCYKFLVPLIFAVCAIAGNAPALLPLSIPLFFVPDALLYLCMKRRMRTLAKALADTIDLMMLAIESGLALDSAIQRVIQKHPQGGALIEELEILGHHILLGVTRERAYKDIYLRTGTPEIKKFAAALSQSSKHGLSLGQLLRTQSELLRSENCMRAEKNANKIPIWMTFPMCFLILPALLMILAGPAIIQNQAMVAGMNTDAAAPRTEPLF